MAEKKFFVDINLQGSALTNAKIGTNSGIGSTEGAFGYDSASHRLQYFNGSATQNVANLSDISAVTGGLIFQGGYDPTTDTPDITDGTALKGFFWAATAAGTFLGESVQVGDSIVAKVDAAGATIADWLILQGNIVIATDSVDGISRLATQTEANTGTEAGAVVITPATLQGKIDAQITPEISSKLSLTGGTMSGGINMGNSIIDGASQVNAAIIVTDAIDALTGPITMSGQFDYQGYNGITNLGTPTAGGDATNKTYVDGAASTAQANAEATASADATAKADAAEAAANAYTDTGLAAKLNLAGGTMTGDIDMDGNQIDSASIVSSRLDTDLWANNNKITDLATPTDGGDATNKEYVDTTAATAESNANDYTDTEIAAQSFTAVIATGDWTLDGDLYTVAINHNFGTTYLQVSALYEGQFAEFAYDSTNANILFIGSSFVPTQNVAVNINKSGGNL